MDTGPTKWALLNGSTLGIGVFSRLGFWLWYIVPFGSLLVGDIFWSALIYGVYGCVRGGSVWIILSFQKFYGSKYNVNDWLINQHRIARLIASVNLLVMGVIIIFMIAL